MLYIVIVGIVIFLKYGWEGLGIALAFQAVCLILFVLFGKAIEAWLGGYHG